MPDAAAPRVRALLVGKAAPERGGIPTFLETMVRRLPAHGVDVALLNLADAEGPRAGGSVSVGNLRATARDVSRVRRAARRADVVHVHSACAPGTTLVRAGALCAAARVAGRPVVLHVHGGLLGDWLQGRRRHSLARAVLRPANEIVAVAEAPAAALRRALRRAVPVIPNGVDLERFAGRRPGARAGEPAVLFVGGLTPRKGVLDLLEASAEVRARGVAHRLVLAGGTPDDGTEVRDRMEAALREAGDHVSLVPPAPHDQMPALYAAADVFCLPSWWEAQPLSLLEAMASGLPSVVSDVGDVRRMTDGGRAAVVVPPRDPARLADALEALLVDPDRRATLGAQARRHVERGADVDDVAAQVSAAYRHATRPRPATKKAVR